MRGDLGSSYYICLRAAENECFYLIRYSFLLRIWPICSEQFFYYGDPFLYLQNIFLGMIMARLLPHSRYLAIAKLILLKPDLNEQKITFSHRRKYLMVLGVRYSQVFVDIWAANTPVDSFWIFVGRVVWLLSDWWSGAARYS